MELLPIIALALASWSVEAAPSGNVVFPDSQREGRKLEEPILPPKLPVIAHLENDPSTLIEVEKVATRSSKPKSEIKEVNPRFGFNHGFDVSPNSDGGLTASFSNGYSGLGGSSQSASQSVSFGFNNGFQASQSSSLASSYNRPGFIGSSYSGSQSSSQASSFSTSLNGISASAAASSASAGNGHSSSNSQSAGFGSNYGGHSIAGSQSASSAGSGNSFSNAAGSASNFGHRPSGNRPSGARPSGNSYWNRPSENHYSGSSGSGYSSDSNYGVGSIDIRQRPNTYKGVAATSIVFPGETSSRDIEIGGSDDLILFDDARWRGSRNYKTKNGGLSDWLSILVSD